MSTKYIIFLFVGCFVVGCSGPLPLPTPVPSPTSLPSPTATEEIAVDGLAIAHVYTWNDLNKNGIPDKGEPPLPYITTSVDFSDTITDTSGWGTPSSFKPGCRADCSKDTDVAVKVPPGYRSTTPVRYPIASENENYYFGFYLENPDAIISFPNQPEWQKSFINRGAKVLKFNYADGNLEITVDKNYQLIDDYYPQSLLDNDYYYGVFVFSILDNLVSMDIDIHQAQISLSPSGDVYLCDWMDIVSWGEWESDTKMLGQVCERVK